MKKISKIPLGCYKRGVTFPGVVFRYKDNEGSPASIAGLAFSCDMVDTQSGKKVFELPIEIVDVGGGVFRVTAFDLNFPIRNYIGDLVVVDNDFKSVWGEVELQIIQDYK